MAKQTNKYALIRVENNINPIERKTTATVVREYTSLKLAEDDFRNNPNYLDDNIVVTFYVIETSGVNLANLEREQYQNKILLDHKLKVSNKFISRVEKRYAIIKIVYHLDHKDSGKFKSCIIAQYDDLTKATKNLKKHEETIEGSIYTKYCVMDLNDYLGEEVENLNFVFN